MTNPTKEPNPNTVPGNIGGSGYAFRMILFGLSKNRKHDQHYQKNNRQSTSDEDIKSAKNSFRNRNHP